MLIEVTGRSLTNKGITTLTVTHKNNPPLSWNVSSYDRVGGYADIPTLFDSINAFWATLPEDQQSGIWGAYTAIHSALQLSRSLHELDAALKVLVARLYSFMPYEQIEYWVNYKAGVIIPANVPAVYSPTQPDAAMVQMRREQEQLARLEAGETDDVDLPSMSAADLNYPREMTYLRKDYQELAVLSVALRPMVPIWGEYIDRAAKQVGGLFVSEQAMGLLYSTELPHVPAMDRLLLYMEHSVAMQKQISHSMIVGGLSTTTLPSWLLAGCCVKRLVFGRLHVMEEKKSIIANVYRFVNSALRSLDTNFGGKISAKKAPSEMGEEDNSSLVDMYKVKQEVSDANLVAMAYYTSRFEDMVKLIDPTLPMAMAHECLNFMSTIQGRPIHDHQKWLTQWVMAKRIAGGDGAMVLSPRGILFLPKKSIMRVMAVTQAALWHWGLFDLAALVSVIARPTTSSTTQIGNESRARVNKEELDELTRIYPHYQRQKSKDKNLRQQNVGYRAIDIFCDTVTTYEWQLNAPPGIASQVQAIGASKVLIVPQSIRTSVAQLFIKLDSN